jgi:hypothetical protein
LAACGRQWTWQRKKLIRIIEKGIDHNEIYLRQLSGLKKNITTWIKQNTALAAFISYWVIVFVVYLPAAEAGRVGDFPGWVDALTSMSFADYVNRKGSGIASMYQFTQIVSYLFYKLFGANAWLWHLLYVTLQAANALLLFIFFGRFFERSEVRYSMGVAFAGGMLFCLSPHISEVVVSLSAGIAGDDAGVGVRSAIPRNRQKNVCCCGGVGLLLFHILPGSLLSDSTFCSNAGCVLPDGFQNCDTSSK